MSRLLTNSLARLVTGGYERTRSGSSYTVRAPVSGSLSDSSQAPQVPTYSPISAISADDISSIVDSSGTDPLGNLSDFGSDDDLPVRAIQSLLGGDDPFGIGDDSGHGDPFGGLPFTDPTSLVSDDGGDGG